MLNKIAYLEAKIEKDPFADLPQTYEVRTHPLNKFGQLIKLRDAWRRGWVPGKREGTEDTGSQIQFGYTRNNWTIGLGFSCSHSALSFPDKETAERFLKQFEKLINECKPLLT